MLMRPSPAEALPLQQSDVFRRGLRALLCNATAADLEGCGSAVVISRDLFGLPLRLTSRGPIWSASASTAERAAALRASGLNIINAETKDPALRAAGYRMLVTPAHAAILPTGDKDMLLASAHAKWRNRARLLEKAGLQVSHEIFDPLRDGWIRRAEQETRKRKGYRALPFDLILAMARVDREALRLFRVDRDGAPLAVMLVVVHGTSASYHLGWCGPDGRQVSAHHAMLVAAADWAARQGITALDLGLVDTVSAPGLARFKLGSGAQLRRLGGTWGRMPRLGWT